MQEFITSSTTLGALLGSLVAGIMSDWTGRKPVLGIADILFIGGAIAQAVCNGIWSMVHLSYTHIDMLPITYHRLVVGF